MLDLTNTNNQIQLVATFKELVDSSFVGNINALFWQCTLEGDYFEIIDNITSIEPDELQALNLDDQGNLARQTILADWDLLKAHGAQPTHNLIKYYEMDDKIPTNRNE
jgi:hypothetical protein